MGNSYLLRPLTTLERLAVVFILGGSVAFGGLVEYRSACLERRMGDLGVYLRAAWAVRVDPGRLYDVSEDNGWHYSYPPLFAILMAPLADAPREADAAGMTPYPVSVAVFYAFSLLCLAAAVHWLASALEWASPDPAVRYLPRGCRRWWLLRLLPVLVCLPPIGHTLMRGQANLLLLALICGGMAALIRGRRFTAGGFLAGAVCLKIFPAFLLLYPLWRRDWRCLLGCVSGLFVGLVLVPLVVFGPRTTVGCYQKLATVLVGPALNLGQDESRAKELIETTATDSQSFVAVIHNLMHLDQHRWERPSTAIPEVRYAHFALGGLITLLTLAAAWRRRRDDGPTAAVFFLGALTLVMLFLSPVCHTHYFALSLPLVMGLLARRWEECPSGRVGAGLWLLLGMQFVGAALPLFPIFEKLKDGGLMLVTALALWATACVVLWRVGTPSRPEPAAGETGLRAA